MANIYANHKSASFQKNRVVNTFFCSYYEIQFDTEINNLVIKKGLMKENTVFLYHRESPNQY